MSDFTTSTHRGQWVLSQNEVMQKIEAANQRAVQALHEYGSTRLDIQADGSLAYPVALSENGTEKKKGLPAPLSVQEEKLICRFYEQKIQEVCAAFAFPNKIQATAIIYFKRFYINHSVMELDPKHIMLTCIYISCKVEEFHVSAEELGKGIQQDHQVVLSHELTLLQALDFNLIVYPPYRPLEGFIYDLMSLFGGQNGEKSKKIQELHEAAKFQVDLILLTDCPLLFPPGQLALAALRRANLQENAIDFERYLKSLTDRKQSNHSLTELFRALDSINAVVDVAKRPEQDVMSRLGRKLRNCRHPELQEESRKRDRKGKHKLKRTSQDENQITDSSPMLTNSQDIRL